MKLKYVFLFQINTRPAQLCLCVFLFNSTPFTTIFMYINLLLGIFNPSFFPATFHTAQWPRLAGEIDDIQYSRPALTSSLGAATGGRESHGGKPAELRMKQAAELTELTGQRQFNCEQAGDEGDARVCVCVPTHIHTNTPQLPNPGGHFHIFSRPWVESYCVL